MKPTAQQWLGAIIAVVYILFLLTLIGLGLNQAYADTPCTQTPEGFVCENSPTENLPPAPTDEPPPTPLEEETSMEPEEEGEPSATNPTQANQAPATQAPNNRGTVALDPLGQARLDPQRTTGSSTQPRTIPARPKVCYKPRHAQSRHTRPTNRTQAQIPQRARRHSRRQTCKTPRRHSRRS